MKKKGKRFSLICSVMMLALISFATASFASFSNSYIDFEIGPPNNQDTAISFGGGALYGSDISMTQVVGVGTPANNGQSFNIGAIYPGYGYDNELQFQATNYLGSGGGTGWYFGPGGEIAIETHNLAGSTIDLFEGAVTSVQIVPFSSSFKVIIGGLAGTPDGNLANYYGYPGTQQWEADFNLSLFVTATAGGNFNIDSYAAGSGDLAASPAPAPASCMLLGLGLIVLMWKDLPGQSRGQSRTCDPWAKAGNRCFALKRIQMLFTA